MRVLEASTAPPSRIRAPDSRHTHCSNVVVIVILIFVRTKPAQASPSSLHRRDRRAIGMTRRRPVCPCVLSETVTDAASSSASLLYLHLPTRVAPCNCARFRPCPLYTLKFEYKHTSKVQSVNES